MYRAVGTDPAGPVTAGPKFAGSEKETHKLKISGFKIITIV